LLGIPNRSVQEETELAELADKLRQARYDFARQRDDFARKYHEITDVLGGQTKRDRTQEISENNCNIKLINFNP
jgi:hypothetical protein